MGAWFGLYLSDTSFMRTGRVSFVAALLFLGLMEGGPFAHAKPVIPSIHSYDVMNSGTDSWRSRDYPKACDANTGICELYVTRDRGIKWPERRRVRYRCGDHGEINEIEISVAVGSGMMDEIVFKCDANGRGKHWYTAQGGTRWESPDEISSKQLEAMGKMDAAARKLRETAAQPYYCAALCGGYNAKSHLLKFVPIASSGKSRGAAFDELVNLCEKRAHPEVAAAGLEIARVHMDLKHVGGVDVALEFAPTKPENACDITKAGAKLEEAEIAKQEKELKKLLAPKTMPLAGDPVQKVVCKDVADYANPDEDRKQLERLEEIKLEMQSNMSLPPDGDKKQMFPLIALPEKERQAAIKDAKAYLKQLGNFQKAEQDLQEIARVAIRADKEGVSNQSECTKSAEALRDKFGAFASTLNMFQPKSMRQAFFYLFQKMENLGREDLDDTEPGKHPVTAQNISNRFCNARGGALADINGDIGYRTVKASAQALRESMMSRLVSMKRYLEYRISESKDGPQRCEAVVEGGNYKKVYDAEYGDDTLLGIKVKGSKKKKEAK